MNAAAQTLENPVAIDFCGMRLESPIVLLSGCVGFGEEYTRVDGFSNRDVGAVVLKGTTGTPRLGASFSVNLTQARANASAFLLHGLSDRSWSGVPLPFHLGPAGAPGCWLWCSGEIIRAAATNAAGATSIGLAVPNDRSLIGGVFFNDWLIHDPTANALQFVTSGGGRGRFGDS